jgi:hypothetical protein
MFRPTVEDLVKWASFVQRHRYITNLAPKIKPNRYPGGFNKAQECARHQRQIERGTYTGQIWRGGLLRGRCPALS